MESSRQTSMHQACPERSRRNHLTGTSVMSGSDGAWLGTIKYTPFGETRSVTGVITTDKLYTGQRKDISTGLYYYEARYYDPVIGRFLSPDSVMADLTNPQSLNRYSYVLNNPLKFNDPTGNWPNLKNVAKSIAKGVSTAVNAVKQNIDLVQTVLDVAGMIPVVGVVADVANGVISACRGDWVGAGMSLVSAIPGIGDAVGGIKLAAKAADIAVTLANTAKTVEKADDIIDAGKAVLKSVDAVPGNIKSLRSSAVRNAWKEEKALVERTGKGTRDWTEKQVTELLDNGKVKGFQGHHINSVSIRPDLAGNPNNIAFYDRAEHFLERLGNWQNPTIGKLLSR